MNIWISDDTQAERVDREAFEAGSGVPTSRVAVNKWGVDRPNKAKWQEEMMKAFDRYCLFRFFGLR